jgi:hypothetical protein
MSGKKDMVTSEKFEKKLEAAKIKILKKKRIEKKNRI